MYKDIECPYCQYEFDICHDDGHGYEEAVPHEEQCPDCEKYFVFYTTISFSYEAAKADCLNGESHNWGRARKLWHDERVSKDIYRRSCRDCGAGQQEADPNWGGVSNVR